MSESKSLTAPVEALLDWKFVKENLAAGCPDKEFALLMEKSKAKGLNPIKGEVYYVKTWNSAINGFSWGERISIDALRKQAFSSGEVEAIKREYDPAKKTATVRLWKKGCSKPFEETVELMEFQQMTKEGKPNHVWAKMPGQMLKKCAEATVLRMAFPDRLSALYIAEEMPESIKGHKADEIDDGSPVEIPHETVQEPKAAQTPATPPQAARPPVGAPVQTGPVELATEKQLATVRGIIGSYPVALSTETLRNDFLHWFFKVTSSKEVPRGPASDFISNYGYGKDKNGLAAIMCLFLNERGKPIPPANAPDPAPAESVDTQTGEIKDGPEPRQSYFDFAAESQNITDKESMKRWWGGVKEALTKAQISGEDFNQLVLIKERVLKEKGWKKEEPKPAANP